MPDLHEYLHSQGMDLGEKRDPRQDFLDYLQSKGVYLHPVTITQLRRGEWNGRDLLMRLTCADVLNTGSALAKHSYYNHLAIIGIDPSVRTHQQARPHKYNSNEYTERIARVLVKESGMDESEIPRLTQIIRQQIRAMRMELVFTEAHGLSSEVRDEFVTAAEAFLENNKIPQNLMNPNIERINQEWDHASIHDFYVKFEKWAARRTGGSFTPYEMGVFARMYDPEGNNTALSELDALILNTYMEDKSVVELADSVRSFTSIPIDDHTIAIHRNVLLGSHPLFIPALESEQDH